MAEGGDGDASEERVTEPLPARWRRVHYRTPTTERNKTFPSLGRSTRDRSLDLRPPPAERNRPRWRWSYIPLACLATCSERQRGEADGTARRDRPRRRGVGAQRADPIQEGVLRQRRGFFVDAYRRSTTHLLVENDEIVAFASVRRDGYIPFWLSTPITGGAVTPSASSPTWPRNTDQSPATPARPTPGARLLRTPRLRGRPPDRRLLRGRWRRLLPQARRRVVSASGSPGSSGGSREVLRIARGPEAPAKPIVISARREEPRP